MLETDDERKLFADFYDAHYGKCVALAFSITRNHAWAEDAVHNAFLKMIRHKDKYFVDLRKRTRTQIVIMVKSAAIDLLRCEKRLDHVLLDDYETIIPNDEPDALRFVTSKEAVEKLQYYVSQLDEVSQTLYEMKWLLEQSDSEIAEEIGISKNAVAIRIHKIRKGLLENMKKDGYLDE
jgi:RNA polymerase sigma-70 factor (ECF subfamily)